MLDRDFCVLLYGNAYAVQHPGGVFGWFPTMDEALAAAKAEGITSAPGLIVPARDDAEEARWGDGPDHEPEEEA